MLGCVLSGSQLFGLMPFTKELPVAWESIVGLRLSQEEYDKILARRNVNSGRPSIVQVQPTYNLAQFASLYLEAGITNVPHSPLLVTLKTGIKSLSQTNAKTRPFERVEQAIGMVWLEINDPDAFSMATAIPLGGYRPRGAGGQVRGDAAKRGYPDLLIDKPMNGFHGLRIEMKKYCSKANPTDDQHDWLTKLAAQGYLAVLCRGHQAMISVMAEYLNITLKNKFTLPEWAIVKY